jgi:hypothetical protein
MAQTVNVIVRPEDRERLRAIIADRRRPLKHIQRANIVLLSADRLPVLEVARRAGVSRPDVAASIDEADEIDHAAGPVGFPTATE